MAVLTKTPTVLKMLKQDHKKVKAIFDEFEEAPSKRNWSTQLSAKSSMTKT